MPKRHRKQDPFPLLKRKVIISCMTDLGISLQESDLRAPQEEKCKIMYAEILKKLMNIDVLTNQPSFNKLDFFQYPQLHESSILSVRLFREMIKFMRTVGVTDFSISDLMVPDPKRTVRNLSAIINFIRWRECKRQLYVPIKKELNELQHKLSAIIAENDRVAETYCDAQAKVEAEAPQAEALKAEIQKLQQEVGGVVICCIRFVFESILVINWIRFFESIL